MADKSYLENNQRP